MRFLLIFLLVFLLVNFSIAYNITNRNVIYDKYTSININMCNNDKYNELAYLPILLQDTNYSINLVKNIKCYVKCLSYDKNKKTISYKDNIFLYHTLCLL